MESRRDWVGKVRLVGFSCVLRAESSESCVKRTSQLRRAWKRQRSAGAEASRNWFGSPQSHYRTSTALRDAPLQDLWLPMGFSNSSASFLYAV